MGSSNPEATKIVMEYMRKYPDLMKLTLAKKIFAENPTKFDSVEKLRSIIRSHSGCNGKYHRNGGTRIVESFMGKVAPMPEEPNTPLVIKSGRAGVIFDIHGYHQVEQVRDFFLTMKEEKIDTLWLGGDILDFESISKWPQHEKRIGLTQELNLVSEMLCDLNDLFPNVKKIYKFGNHEFWWHRKLWENPTLMEDTEIAERMMLEDRLNLKAYGFEKVGDRQQAYFGKLLMLHGHEAKKGGGIYVAKNMLDYFKTDIMFGHFHRKDYHCFQQLRGSLRSYSMPCACRTDASFSGINNQWSQGFGIVDFDEQDFDVQVYTLRNGKIKKS